MIEISVEALFALCFLFPISCIGLGYLLRDFESWCKVDR